MKYEHLIAAIAREPWAIDPLKGWSIFHEFIAFRAAGGMLTEDERAAKIGTQQARNIRERSGSLAMIPLHGVMSQRANMMGDVSTPRGASADLVGRRVDAAVADDSVKAIILHVDSPGGSVYGVRELAAKVTAAKARKPVIAQVDSVAASAAYWVATQATELVITPGGDVGSIGIYTVHEDISSFLDAQGVKETMIHAGKYKVEANPYEPLGDEARAHLQERVDGAYRDFVAAVASGRSTTSEAVQKHYGQGRVVDARTALSAGMVDRIATFDETQARYTRRQTYSRRASAAMALARS